MTSGTPSAEPAVLPPSSARGTIRLSGVRKTYTLGTRSVEALRGLDLLIERAGFYAIMGPSGSGKSTLLHLLAGLDLPDSGEVEVAGRRLDRMSESQLTLFRRHSIGIVFQQFNLIPTMTALENVTLPGMLDGMSAAEREERGVALLRTLGLGERTHHRPDALSGGEQQRTAIARALLFSPPLLLADEPTGNLDSRSSDQMWNLLAELAEQRQMTVVMVTHEPAAAVNCERIFFIRDGLIAGSLDTDGRSAADIAAELATGPQQPGR